MDKKNLQTRVDVHDFLINIRIGFDPKYLFDILQLSNNKILANKFEKMILIIKN